MKITTSMSTSSYESIYNQVQKDYLTLNSKRSSFSSTTSDATTKLNATDFSGWEDSVATKMKQAVDDFKGTVTSVESDLTAGNYNVLLTKISELVSALEKCKSIRNSLNNKEYSRRNTTRYYEISEAFYEDAESALGGAIRPNEILVIIENNEDRRKLHCFYDENYDKSTPYFDSTKIVGCINSSFEFTQNNRASLLVEKPVSLKLKNN